MPEVSIKFLMPLKVAFTEKKVPREAMGKALEQLTKALKEKKVKISGAVMALLHEDPNGLDLQKALLEICLPISGKIKGSGDLKEKELEKGAFACIPHSSSLEKLPETYQAVLKWITDNGYRVAGPGREIYPQGTGEPGDALPGGPIEIQFPVRK